MKRRRRRWTPDEQLLDWLLFGLSVAMLVSVVVVIMAITLLAI